VRELGEVGPAIIVKHDQLAVEDEALGCQLVQAVGYMPMLPADVVAVASEEARRSAIANRQHPEAIVFDLEEPLVAVKRLMTALHDLEREFVGAEHGSYFPEKRRSLKGRIVASAEARPAAR
jgi:hypothetical protein